MKRPETCSSGADCMALGGSRCTYRKVESESRRAERPRRRLREVWTDHVAGLGEKRSRDVPPPCAIRRSGRDPAFFKLLRMRASARLCKRFSLRSWRCSLRPRARREAEDDRRRTPPATPIRAADSNLGTLYRLARQPSNGVQVIWLVNLNRRELGSGVVIASNYTFLLWGYKLINYNLLRMLASSPPSLQHRALPARPRCFP